MSKPSAPPPLSERRKPGLSETLPGPFAPTRCAKCGDINSSDYPLSRWLEHDENDRVPDRPRVVVLCSICDAIIEPHARLYRKLDPGEAFPGCMGICVKCDHRRETSCTNPQSRFNGGPGLKFEWDKEPIRAFLCGGRAGGLHVIYSGPVRRCDGRSPQPAHDEPTPADNPPARQPSLDL